MKNRIGIYIAFWLCCFAFSSSGQINYGSIEYEIKVNKEKRSSTSTNRGFDRRGNRAGTASDYIVEKATLYFQDSLSLFITEAPEEMRDQWSTYQTQTLIDFGKGVQSTHIEVLGETYDMLDEAQEFEWKLTGKIRTIAGVECDEVYSKINDSTKIYAWFYPHVIPSVGPESYWNLPGALMGLAYEDGSVTYFATSLNEEYPNLLAIYEQPKVKKPYTRKELIEKLKSQMDSNSRYAGLLRDVIHFH